MEMLQQIIIPLASAVGGFLLANWKTLIRWKRDNDNELISSVKNAREDILRLYKIIDEMEAINSELKLENVNLKRDKDKFERLADEAKKELDKVMAYVIDLESRLKINRDEKNKD